jgi:hypothetical protein
MCHEAGLMVGMAGMAAMWCSFVTLRSAILEP